MPSRCAYATLAVALLCALSTHFLGPLVSRCFQMSQMRVPAAEKSPAALRIGILGAADIAPMALIWPSWKTKHVVVTAVAARDPRRAETFADKYGIPNVHASYEALLQDPDIDAVYNPLPNGLHYRWTMKALLAGKHVLCEKPVASNAAEAREMMRAAEEQGKVIMEAFHYRFHPVARRMAQIVSEGELGRVLRVETQGSFTDMIHADTDIRWNNAGAEPRLAGGSLMDIGCYAVNCFRLLAAAAGASSYEVINATAQERFPGVDGEFTAHIQAGNIQGSIVASMTLPWYQLFRARAKVVGEEATLEVENFIAPFLYHSLTITPNKGSAKVEKLYGDGATTYELQLQAFVEAVRTGTVQGVEGSMADALSNMQLLDSMYTKAGMEPRIGFPLDE